MLKVGSTQIYSGTLNSLDGIKIFFRVWNVDQTLPRKAILVLPGIGMHSGYYKLVSDFISPDGFLIIGLDLRGHGLSGGPRGTIPRPEEVVADLDAMLEWIRNQYKPEQLYVLGESMGGLILLNYAALSQAGVNGFVFVAPALRLCWKQIVTLDNIKIIPPFLFTRDKPVVSLAGKRLDEATVDGDFKRHRRTDPLALNEVSVNYLLGLHKMMSGWKKKAGIIQRPSIILHGKADNILSWKGSSSLCEALGTLQKKLVLLDTARHTLFWDPATPKVFEEIRHWLKML